MKQKRIKVISGSLSGFSIHDSLPTAIADKNLKFDESFTLEVLI